MGGAESVVRNVDKRTSRREHRSSFEPAVARFRTNPFPAPVQPNSSVPSHNLRVYIRKRPFFPNEYQQGEFDVISCLPSRVVVHDARMQPDMRNMFVNHHDFCFDEVFDDTADNEQVYARSARDIVHSMAAGGHGTVMMYGQTGSGKTYTMSSFHKQAAEELFSLVGSKVVSVCFIELLGDKSFDMLNAGAACRLVSAPDGSVHPHPCVEVDVKDANELLAIIRMAGRLRATAATGVHDQSSRSHALCRIFVNDPDRGGSSEEGCLTLVDLAGTEHRIDNAEHNAERQKEGAKINASLAALKECIRATAAGAKFVAFRQNRLTQLLRGCFSSTRPHPTIVIATVSPSSKDTEHSLNTLRHACIMDGQGEGKARQSAHVTGGAVTKESLGEIDVTGIARAKAAARRSGKSPRPSDERSRPNLAHQTKQSNTVRRSTLDRRCMDQLPPSVADRLLAARAGAGNERQKRRLQTPDLDCEEADRGEASFDDTQDSRCFTGQSIARDGSPPSNQTCFSGRSIARDGSPSSNPTCSRDSHEDQARRSMTEEFPPCLQDAWEENSAGLQSLEEIEALPPDIRPALAEQVEGFQALDSAFDNLKHAVQGRGSASEVRRPVKEFPHIPLDGVEVVEGEDGTNDEGWQFATSNELPRTPSTGDFRILSLPEIDPEPSPEQVDQAGDWPEREHELARTPVDTDLDAWPEKRSALARSPVDTDLDAWPEKRPALARSPVDTDLDAWPEKRPALARSPVGIDSAHSTNLMRFSASREEAAEEQEVQNEEDVHKADALFRRFCIEGREATTWSKNDLRLINNCILPGMFGPSTRIDWAHPNAALDQLELLVCGPAPSEQSQEQSQERPRRLHGRQPSQQTTMQEQSRSTHQLTRNTASSSSSSVPTGKAAARRQASGGMRQSSSLSNCRRDAVGVQRPSLPQRGTSSKSQNESTPPQRNTSRKSEAEFTSPPRCTSSKSQDEDSPPQRSGSGRSPGEQTPSQRSSPSKSYGERTPPQRRAVKSHGDSSSPPHGAPGRSQAEGTVLQRRSSTKSTGEQEWHPPPDEGHLGGKGITNLERQAQVASAQSDVKRWLEELREQIRRDDIS